MDHRASFRKPLLRLAAAAIEYPAAAGVVDNDKGVTATRGPDDHDTAVAVEEPDVTVAAVAQVPPDSPVAHAEAAVEVPAEAIAEPEAETLAAEAEAEAAVLRLDRRRHHYWRGHQRRARECEDQG